ncbi:MULTISPECIES: serine hydrolase domain-containing protein [unclassified Mammaliicoccus]|uniref:serine hydrolase n=1 Tax=Mammaliicoccus TaxID=2803850 RepID=UPI001EFBE21E|nr:MULTISPECIES: serine hydrolase domain-containing protein [unclassified Mammaliicoccus]
MKKLNKLILCIIAICLIIFLKDVYQARQYKKEQSQTHIYKKHKENKQTSKINFSEERKIDKYLKSKSFNGNITIYKHNQPVMSKAYGFRDIENNINNDRKSMYLLESANKFITGLMLHRSGLAKAKFPTSAMGLNGAIESNKLNGVVPQNYHNYFYNDANYITIAKVIENATKKSYAQNLNELIINKAHLKYTARYDAITQQEFMVKGYKFKNNQSIYFYPSTLDKYDGAGNIYISTDDMAKLVSQFKSNKLLSKSSTDNLLSKASTNLYPSPYRY